MSNAFDRDPDSSSLYRLNYVSRVTLETMSRLDLVMLDILTVSRAWNSFVGLTGLLFCDGRWFTQVLEGTEREVEAIYDRIAVDLRHTSPTVRSRGPITERHFEHWSMCGLTLSDIDDSILDLPIAGLDLMAMEPQHVLDLLSQLSKLYGNLLDERHANLVRRDLRGADR
jgi:hypothetical protein